MWRTYPYDVFVSYRWVSPDQEWVREQLEPALTKAGLRVCLDVNDFVPGRNLMLEMTRAGTESARALCVLSPDYFAGNRMVDFEGLMARQRDPAGAESRLIPLILRPTDLPDWLRGLIPVDWTVSSNVGREWRKLLTTLGAPEATVAPPPPVVDSAAGRTEATIPPVSASIVSVTKIVAREGPAFGYDIVIRNDGYDNVFIQEIELGGECVLEILGAGALVDRVSYDILIDSSVGDTGTSAIAGTTYETSTPDFGKQCTGALTHELNTQTHQESWRYTVSVPVYLRVPGRDRVIVSLRFHRNLRSMAQRTGDGDSAGFHRSGKAIRDTHSLTARLEGGGILCHDMDRALLAFLLQREPLGESGNLLQLINTAIRDAENERAQATGAVGRDRLQKALMWYRHAEMLVTLLPSEHQDNLHMVRRAIRDLEQQISSLTSSS